jgi:hypothetical protein
MASKKGGAGKKAGKGANSSAKSATRDKSNTKPTGSKASPSPTPGDQGPAPAGEAPPKGPVEEKTVGEDSKLTAAEDAALDGRPRTVAGAKAVIHPIPHTDGVKHLPGEDPAPDAPHDPNLEQTLWGLRMAGRLYRGTHPDRGNIMIEADDEQCAKEAAAKEFQAMDRRRAKEDAETPKKVQLVDPAPRRAEFSRTNVRVRKLTA